MNVLNNSRPPTDPDPNDYGSILAALCVALALIAWVVGLLALWLVW
jgi:hypothetical protein